MLKSLLRGIRRIILGPPLTPEQAKFMDTLRRSNTPEFKKEQEDRLAQFRENCKKIVEEDTKRAKREQRARKGKRSSVVDCIESTASSSVSSSCDCD